MSGNRSLDEFAGVGAGEGSDEGGAEAEGVGADVATDEASADRNGEPAAVEESTDAPDASDSTDAPADGAGAPVADDERTDDETLDPPASTYVWNPDGGPCGACGSTVEERWRDGDDLVCAGCKDW